MNAITLQQQQTLISSKVQKRLVGTSLKRKEDIRFLTGQANFVTDFKPRSCLYAAFVRSTSSHAKVKRIRVENAKASPGIIAIYSLSDLMGLVGEVPCAVHLPQLRHVIHYPLANDEVNYYGEPVAIILAESECEAEDAAELVEIEYDPLPAIVDPEQAIMSANLVHEAIGTNVAYEFQREFGDVEGGFAKSPHVFDFRLYDQRVFSASMEPRAVISSYDISSDQLTVWSATQIPHVLRTFVSRAISHPENKIRVVAPDIGGAFGSKACVYSEEILIPLLAKLTKQPVRWIETRSESFVATSHGRDVILHVKIGVDPEGKILAMKTRVIADLGAFLHLYTPQFAPSIALSIPSNYKIPAYGVELACVYTNKMSTESYRGVVNAEACFFIERIMDLVASKMNLDPADVRLKNFIELNESPYLTVTGSVNDIADHPRSVKLALDRINYANLRREQKEMRKQGRYLGIGLSSYWELGGVYPADMTREIGVEHGFFESASVRILPSGVVSVVTGTSCHGQGHETTFAQVVSDLLQVPVEQVNIEHGDTSAIGYGIGTFGSRSAAVGGGAISIACDRVKQKSRLIAASLLGVRPAEIEMREGRFFAGDKSVTLNEVAREAYLATHLPPSVEPGLEATCYFNPPRPTYASGTHVAIVEVDIQTGKVKILRFVAVNDFGNIINPLIVEGQLHGGLLQGLGQALLEEVSFGNDGQQLTSNFLDYLIPTSLDPLDGKFEDFEFSYYATGTEANQLGVKGMGECGAIAAPPAIANAVEDALRDFDGQILEMPIRPEKIWKIVNSYLRRKNNEF
jgi:aerobic carbon-monoxide dehydrogenase large subunit